MNYTFHQLQVFLKVVENKSVTKASQELFMTQPAVSIQLKKFQEQFEIPLTEVIGRQLYITNFGLEIAQIAKRVMLEMEAIKYQTMAFKGMLTGKLSISSASTGKYVMPYFLTGFMKANPGIELELDVTNKSAVLESLKRNETDLALVSTLPVGMEVEELELLENKLYLVSQDTRYDKRKALIYREEGSATRQAMEDFFRKKGDKKRKRIELVSNEAVKQAVVAGLGNSIIPLIGLRNQLEMKRLHILDMPGLPIRTQWRLVWLKEKKLSPASRGLLDYITAHKEKIKEEQFKWYLEYS